MSEHTPTPYELARLTDVDQVCLVLGGDNGVVASTHLTWRMKETNEANARFIVTACNNFEAMKDAIKKSAEIIGKSYMVVYTKKGEGLPITQVYDTLRGILSQIEGE